MPLVAAGELSDDTLLTIEITFANDVNIGEAIESDIVYGVSDETNLISDGHSHLKASLDK